MIHMTLLSDAMMAVANRLAHTEKTAFELRQYIDAELEKQKKAFPWMFSHETLRIPPTSTVVSVVSPEEVNQQIRDCLAVPVYATSAYDSDKAYGVIEDDSVTCDRIYWSVPADEITRWDIKDEVIIDISDEEVRAYCYGTGEGCWINIYHPVQLREVPNGAHIIVDGFGNTYTMKPTWNCIMTTMKEDDKDNG
jgi:hypothetical protein